MRTKKLTDHHAVYMAEEEPPVGRREKPPSGVLISSTDKVNYKFICGGDSNVDTQ